MKKSKIISVIFAVFFWLLFNACLFVWLPLLYPTDFFSTDDAAAEAIFNIASLGLPICFWLIRFYLKKTNKWHKCGTILFHSLNGISIFCLTLMQILSLPNLFDRLSWGGLVFLSCAVILVRLLIIDLLIVGVKWLVHLIKWWYEK